MACLCTKHPQPACGFGEKSIMNEFGKSLPSQISKAKYRSRRQYTHRDRFAALLLLGGQALREIIVEDFDFNGCGSRIDHANFVGSRSG
jgi:hypothetical protein